MGNEPKEFAPRNGHECWFCRPSAYPDMLEGMTLCARCGRLCEGRKAAMDIYPECDAYLDNKFKETTNG